MLKNITKYQKNILLHKNHIIRHLTDSKKIIIFSSSIIILGLADITIAVLNDVLVFAESYESSAGISFTLNPTINIAVSGDLTIANLTPGDYKDSNTITVSASSNALSGYSLYANTGNSSNNSNELRKDGIDTTNKFTSITIDQSSLSNFNDNTWGYSFCNTTSSIANSSTPIDCTTSTNWTDYSGLPVYSDSNDKLLISSNTNITTNLQFKIGAKASINQIAGEYTNTINFIGIANPNPVPIYIQDITLASCQVNVGTNGNPANIGDNITVVDRRDNNIYTVRYINGACWMTENLRITSSIGQPEWVISKEGSNFDNINTWNIHESDLKDNDWIATQPQAHLADASDVVMAQSHGYSTTAEELGVWYNFCAASANNSAGCSFSGKYVANESVVTGDICPYNWHLPTHDANSSAGSIDSILNYASLFATLGGYYYKGVNTPLGYSGYWWTATANSETLQYRLQYYGSNTTNIINSDKRDGNNIRCVRTS